MAVRSTVGGIAPSRPRRRRFVARLGRLLLLFAGLLVVLPAALIVLFRFVPVPVTPLMLTSALSQGHIDRTWVPLERISPNLVRAVIASEDNNFCSHWGFDLEAISKAIEHNATSNRLRGASTISQQTAKNLFLPPTRNWIRKGFEAYLTVFVEALWPKRRIVEVYLNIVEWGPGRFGAEAAAEANFHVPAAKLSTLQAARLAAILPSPNRYRADRPGPFVQRQSGVIAARMGEVARDRLDACVFQ